MDTVEDLSAEERRAYDLITSRDGILQSDLWKALDADSRKGSKLAQSLAEKGLVRREETVDGGRKTYLLTPTDGEHEAATPADSVGATDADRGAADDGLDDQEEQALSLIRETNGIYQSEFWKELDVTSRTGSRIASELEERGLIRRREAVHDGQRTYFLEPAKRDLEFSLLMAGDMISPMVGDEEATDPIDSDRFSQWVLRLAQEER